MPGPVPGIHVFAKKQDVDGRDEPGHDETPVAGVNLLASCRTTVPILAVKSP